MKTSLMLNGYLIDTVQIFDWYNHNTFGAHSPFQVIKHIEKLVQEETLNEIQKMYLIFQLSLLNNYGYWIPDDVFRGAKPPYKRVSSKVTCLHTDIIEMTPNINYYVIT